jgi:seryl-tRNA synthetase
MLDLRLLRDEPDAVRAALARRGADELLDDVIAADAHRRKLAHQVDERKHDQNVVSKQIGTAPAGEKQRLLEQAREVKAEIEALEPQLRAADEELELLASRLPNLPHESVPRGSSDDDNLELRAWREPRSREPTEDHLDIGRRLSLIDTDRAARTSGTRFAYLFGDLVYLEFALARFAMDSLAPHGFVPVVPPFLVRREVMFGAGELPGDEAQMYVTQDGLYLIATSEHSIAALHMDEDIDEADLPLRYAGFSPCFRREAGTYGRDTRGIFRLHQFDKVEMFSFCRAEDSWNEFDFLVSRQEELLQALELPYRVMVVCTGEMGKKAAKQIDIETWFPGQGRYRELTSCSNCTDYQARRLHVSAKGKGGRRLVHTLNGTGFAIGRTIAALLENYADDDGGVHVPNVLRSYMPEGMERIVATQTSS